jgi:hypothetical protein
VAKGERSTWDLTTGFPRGNKKKAPTKTQSTATPAASTFCSKKPKAEAPKNSGYKGSNYEPNYQSRYQEKDSRDREKPRNS